MAIQFDLEFAHNRGTIAEIAKIRMICDKHILNKWCLFTDITMNRNMISGFFQSPGRRREIIYSFKANTHTHD